MVNWEIHWATRDRDFLYDQYESKKYSSFYEANRAAKELEIRKYGEGYAFYFTAVEVVDNE